MKDMFDWAELRRVTGSQNVSNAVLNFLSA